MGIAKKSGVPAVRKIGSGPQHNSMKDKIRKYMDNMWMRMATNEDRGTCPMCQSRPCEIALEPCRHLFCITCVQFLRRCDVCRQPKEGVEVLNRDCQWK